MISWAWICLMLLLYFVEVCLGKEFKSEIHLSLGRVIGMRWIGKALYRMCFCEC